MIYNHITDFDISEEDLELMYNCGVYKICHKSNLSNFYIGSGAYVGKRKHHSGIYNRWTSHLSDLRNNRHHSSRLQNVVNKHGIEGLEFSIIEVCNTKDCIEREQYYLDTMKPAYNTCKIAGNTSGYKHTEKSIELMRQPRKGGKRPPVSNATRKLMSINGKNRDLKYLRTKEIQEKRTLSNKGRKFPEYVYEASRKTIYQFSKGGDFIKEYPSTRAASDYTGIDRGSLNNCALGKRGSAGGYVWSYVGV